MISSAFLCRIWMIAPLSNAEIAIARQAWRIGHTPDQQRILRLAWRCFWYGIIGCVPFIGFGLAAQTSRIYGDALEELGAKWVAPVFWPYWGLAFLFCAGYWATYGFGGVAFIYLLMLAFQTRWVIKSYPSDPDLPWCAGERHLRYGLALGYAGVFTSCYIIVSAFVCAVIPRFWGWD